MLNPQICSIIKDQQQTKNTMDERLRNWAWYVTWGVIGPQPDSTCRSFEKNYVPELGNLYAEAEPTYEPDQKDGDLIEQAIKGLPLQLRQALKLRYVSHPYATLSQIAQAARTTAHKMEVDLANAKRRLQHELDKKAKSNDYKSLLKLQDSQQNK
jgi:DNA-directed RNA polymerase specialized sigma24 family protein